MRRPVKEFYQLIERLHRGGYSLWEIDKAYFEAIRYAKGRIKLADADALRSPSINAIKARERYFLRPKSSMLHSLLIGFFILSLTISLIGIAYLVSLPPPLHIPVVLAIFFVLFALTLRWIL